MFIARDRFRLMELLTMPTAVVFSTWTGVAGGLVRTYVRTGPRDFQHILSVHLAAVLAVEIGGIPSCADKTGAHVNGGRRYTLLWNSPQGFQVLGGSLH